MGSGIKAEDPFCSDKSSIITKIKTVDEALFYVQNTIKHNWSRSVLTHQIESGLFEREGKAIITADN